jgi:glycosyltransferase involved in cell wall biosynthesis
MREFVRMGYRSVIITSDSMGAFNAPVAERPFIIKDLEGITLCRFRTLKYINSMSMRRVLSWLDFELRLLRLPKAALPKPDVIVVSSLSLLTVLNGIRLRRRFKARLVFEVRDIWPLTIVENGIVGPRNPLALLLGEVEKLGYRRANAIVGTMPNLGDHVEKVTGQALPTHCIPMGVDTQAFETPTPLAADYVEAYFPSGKFLVAYAGSMGEANAMSVLFECVESMQLDPNIHFVMVCGGRLPESFTEKYGSLPNLTFAPRVPRSQVHDFLSRCDLLFLSVTNSKLYDYGVSLNKLIDYMLAAKPIVAAYSGYPSMINEAECGTFVPAGDASSLRSAILRYSLMTAAERTVIGQRGRSWLLANRGYGELAKQYQSVLFPQGDPR